MFISIEKNLNVIGTIPMFNITEHYIKSIKENEEKYKKKQEFKFDDYSIIDWEKKEKFINKKLSELPNSKEWQQVNLDDLVFLFDPDSFSLSTMSFMDSLHPKIETSFVFTKDMNYEINEKTMWYKKAEDRTANSEK